MTLSCAPPLSGPFDEIDINNRLSGRDKNAVRKGVHSPVRIIPGDGTGDLGCADYQPRPLGVATMSKSVIPREMPGHQSS